MRGAPHGTSVTITFALSNFMHFQNLLGSSVERAVARRRTLTATVPLLLLVAACSDAIAPVNCVAGEIPSGNATITGTFSSRDCRTTVGVNAQYKDYILQLVHGERYYFNVQSEGAWTPGLELRDTDDAAAPHLMTGWSFGETGGDTRNSQLVFVSPAYGRYRLRVRAPLGATGNFTLVRRLCNGTSTPFRGSTTQSITGALVASDCILRDSWLPSDSTLAHFFVVELYGGQPKTLTIQAAEGSTLRPSVVVRSSSFANTDFRSLRFVAYGEQSSLTVTLDYPESGTYIVGVGGFGFGDTGSYTITATPGSGTP